MRTRWKIDEGFLTFLGVLYIIGATLGPIPVQAIFGSCTRSGCGMASDNLFPMATTYVAFWGPPIILGLALLARYVWSVRPRRITEPVTTDLREAHHDR